MKKLGLCIILLLGPMATPLAQADGEFDALEQEFNDAQQAWYEQLDKVPEKDGVRDATALPPPPTGIFVPRFKAYAEKHAGESEAIPALAWIINQAARGALGRNSPATWAVKQLTKAHAADPALGEHLPYFRYAVSSIGDEELATLYERVMAVNTDKDTAGWASFSLAYLQQRKPRASAADNDASQQTAMDLFRRTAKDYPGTRAAERAASYIYEIEHLQIGMKAPEIVGTGVDGKEIRLSQFRGQVVVLDFWGFW